MFSKQKIKDVLKEIRVSIPYGFNLTREILKRLIPDWQKMKILDLGSGPCSDYLRNRKFRGKDITCLDVFGPYLKECQKLGYKTLHLDASKILENFKPAAFDIILAIDFLEHLEKERGLKLLKDMEKISRRQILIFSPLGFVPMDIDNFGYDNTYFQTHRSAWSQEDFQKRGYNCMVLKNLHKDVRWLSSKKYSDKPVSADAIFAFKIFKK